ncbi:glutathione S-transferase family protein [Rhodospirillum rubrum]|uniref:Glutathione S-transferase-like n=2 Tax=Rhodospirillum rubrum TaxID=1085 RepID=Q2RYG8_RHORT|nr:glutathione S-transferase family protein [Rhodospirillum rubrum]4O7H_A Chain A, Glutathione S-transferase [Rhodospirillum rubrum F11]4O7H_B Chain B, Glutathione S-transferase [Rhodospirillum rubrum F11]ABC20827.1 Glutathione S-transferase-like [Rhodospirillum rubrum ATCC 11170]AEO46494.1 glutathione S-transferase [Rhodospirillum rubrum F11]MBK5956350.1 glutathione S-transferase [Rhodospirillum rubrum]QXG80531.1 glutathione S-transferase family protein [Rhodospirillum rubrum]HCF18566.1 glu
MRRLYHHGLSPAARKVRVALAEKRLDYEAVIEETWIRNESFLAMNPEGEVPVLVEADGLTITDGWAICEYLEEVYPEPSLLGGPAAMRAEVRRLVAWFDRKFNREVTEPLVREKLLKRVISGGAPDSRQIRAGRANVHTHLRYISWLIDRRRWLAGDMLTYADITAACHLSLIDYAGDVPWEDHPQAKEWYALVKSRPSFRPLLTETISPIRPPRHYADLDF